MRTTGERPAVHAGECGGVARVHRHGLTEHRQVRVAGTVFIRRTDDLGYSLGDGAGEERGDIQLLRVARSSRTTIPIFVSNRMPQCRPPGRCPY